MFYHVQYNERTLPSFQGIKYKYIQQIFVKRISDKYLALIPGGDGVVGSCGTSGSCVGSVDTWKM